VRIQAAGCFGNGGGRRCCSYRSRDTHVMVGLVPAIHVLLCRRVLEIS